MVLHTIALFINYWYKIWLFALEFIERGPSVFLPFFAFSHINLIFLYHFFIKTSRFGVNPVFRFHVCAHQTEAVCGP
jgi:hypothetical protein